MPARRSWFFGALIATSLLVPARAAVNERHDQDDWDDGLAHDTAAPNGYDNRNDLTDGGRYDPVSDTWLHILPPATPRV